MDHMQYMDGMEQIDSDIMDQVLRARESYDYNQYTAMDVNRVLKKDRINAEDFGILLSPAAQPFLETMAQKAQKLTREHLEIRFVCLLHFILLIIVRMNAYIVDLIVKIKFIVQS